MWTRSLDRIMYAPPPTEPRAAAARTSPSLAHPAASPPLPALRYRWAVLSVSDRQHQPSSSGARSPTTKRCVAPSARSVARETRADGSRVGSLRGARPLDDADMWTRSLDRGYAPRPRRAPPPRASLRRSHILRRVPRPPRRFGTVWRCCLCRRISISRVRHVRAQRKQSRAGEVPPCASPSPTTRHLRDGDLPLCRGSREVRFT